MERQHRVLVVGGGIAGLTAAAIWRAAVPRPERVRRTHFHIGGEHGAVGICPVAEDIAYLYILEAAQNNPWRDPGTLDVQMKRELPAAR
jgi:hypothetical protein